MKRSMLSAALFAVTAGLAGCVHDNDGNPPGRRGGPGTNWENPPGPAAGPGASPDKRAIRVQGTVVYFARRTGGYYFHPAYGYWHEQRGWWNHAGRCWADRDGNPPGRKGGPGTNWENPPGLKGGPGASPDRFGSCR